MELSQPFVFEEDTRPGMLDVTGLNFIVVLAALANARRHQGNGSPSVIQPETLQARYLSFESFAEQPPAVTDTAFVVEVLGTPLPVVVRSQSRPEVVDISSYEAANGKGLAAQVLQHLLSGGWVDTRRLRRQGDPPPAPRTLATMAMALSTALFG